MCSFPLALLFGIGGILCDRRKLLAIIATCIAAAFVLLYLEAYVHLFFSW